MKAGIITIHNSPSYGASLQSYALWKYISLQGVDCEIIDLHRPYHVDYVPSKKYKPYSLQKTPLTARVKGIVKKVFGYKSEIKAYLTDEAQKKFDKFNAEIKLSRPYYGIDELYADPPYYDVYITGSDQVWNPFQPYCLEPYFLTFAPKGRRCISYAASIGISTLPDNIASDVKKWLEHYDEIAVREETAQKMLEKLTGREIQRVCDPTFLVSQNDWQSIAKSPDYKDYILVFSLSKSRTLIDYVCRLSKECGLSVVVIGNKDKNDEGQPYIVVDDAGPREFLGLISKAEMVVTDSFHGTVFSVIMAAKNFFTYISPDNKRGSRIVDLLESLQLKNHLLDVSLTQSFSELNSVKNDREKVNDLLNSMREESVVYLNKNLKVE